MTVVYTHVLLFGLIFISWNIVQTDACISENGDIYKDGQTWPGNNPCEVCKCEAGVITCARQPCPKLTCDNQIMPVEGCCPKCSGGCVAADGFTFFEESEKWDDTCAVCTCAKGQIICAKKKCPLLVCVNALTEDGDCCPKCKGGCVSLDGSVYKEGQTWKGQEPCDICTCKDGQISCVEEDCAELSCENQVIPKGQCCPKCQGGCVAADGATFFEEGEKWDDTCAVCTCANGQIICAKKECPLLVCANALTEDGDCCPKCKEFSSPAIRQKGCPSPNSGTICTTIPKRMCDYDYECTGKEKCCVTDCGGTACIEAEMRPGVCPLPEPKECFTKGRLTCTVDADCSSDSKYNLCCVDDCGGTSCILPARSPQVRYGCPIPERPIEDIVCTDEVKPSECVYDRDCDGGICCQDYCGNVYCQKYDELPQKPGKCPAVPEFMCSVGGFTFCGVDSDCPGDKKCCIGICYSSSCVDPEFEAGGDLNVLN